MTMRDVILRTGKATCAARVMQFSETFDVAIKPPNAHNTLKRVLHFKHTVPATCFGQSCGYLRGGALERMYYRTL